VTPLTTARPAKKTSGACHIRRPSESALVRRRRATTHSLLAAARWFGVPDQYDPRTREAWIIMLLVTGAAAANITTAAIPGIEGHLLHVLLRRVNGIPTRPGPYRTQLVSSARITRIDANCPTTEIHSEILAPAADMLAVPPRHGESLFFRTPSDPATGYAPFRGGP
jgi:hypothetical protein